MLTNVCLGMIFIFMKNKKGQTMVEFLLVFVVLLAATTGIFALYKSAWKSRYEYTMEHSKIFPTTARGLLLKGTGKMKGYVK